jgi:hypothetical protein
MLEIVHHLRCIRTHNTSEVGSASVITYSVGTLRRGQSESHVMTEANPAYETVCIFNIHKVINHMYCYVLPG